jgi:hypothetical protein
MTRIELISSRTPDGTVVFRAVAVGPAERFRRFVRRILRGA